MVLTSSSAWLAKAMVAANSMRDSESLRVLKFEMAFVRSPLLAFKVEVRRSTLDITRLKLPRFSATVLSKLAAVVSKDSTVRCTFSSAAGSWRWPRC